MDAWMGLPLEDQRRVQGDDHSRLTGTGRTGWKFAPRCHLRRLVAREEASGSIELGPTTSHRIEGTCRSVQSGAAAQSEYRIASLCVF